MKISPANALNSTPRVFPATQPGEARSTQPAAAPPQTDRVEISGAARLRDAISQLPDIRADKVAQAREMIASGQMDTDERLNAALDRLLEEL